MAQIVIGIFPNRETAEHARLDLEAAGFKPTRRNAEDFERPDYYKNQMPQGATLISTEAGARASEVEAIIERAGGRRLQEVAIGGSPMSAAVHEDVTAGIDPGPEERAALAEKGMDMAAEAREREDSKAHPGRKL